MLATKDYPTAATRLWLVLVVLTLVTYAVGESGVGGPAMVALVMAIAFVKGHLVVEGFMGLRQVRPLWRIVMFAYLLLVCALIGLGYAVGLD